jgi:hypothetical protein
VNAKVLALVDCIHEGFEIAAVEDARQGALRIQLRRGREGRSMWFEHFELPAVMQECSCIGVAK